MSYYYAKFEGNPCMGTDESTPLTSLPQTHYFKKYVTHLIKQQCKKIKIDQAFMNSVEKTSKCILNV